jgi:hypothetical protein
MNHNFSAAFVGLDDRIAPTEIRIQMIEPDWHIYGRGRWQKPCAILEYHRWSSPF